MTQNEAFTWISGRLTKLNDRSVLDHGSALSLRDPVDIARELVGLANRARVSAMLRHETGTDPMTCAANLAAYAVALMLSLDRVERLDITSGDAA